MVYEALQHIQGALNAPKGQFNKFGGYAYRSCEDILEAVKPLLAETLSTVTVADEIVQVGSRYYVKATATLHCGEESVSTTAYAREAEEKKGMDESQITGSASSYARKYALNGLFAIDDNRDADATNTGDGKPKPAQKPAGRPQTSAAQTVVQKPAPAPVKEATAAQAATAPEKAQAAQPAAAAPYRFKNGPHAGQTPAEVWAADPDYIRYVSKMPACPAEVLAVMK